MGRESQFTKDGKRRVKTQRLCLPRSVQHRYVVENLLAQDFTAEHEQDKWVTDTMYIPTCEGWLYQLTILDIFIRQIGRLVDGTTP